MIPEAFKKFKENLELTDSFDTLIQQRHNAVRSAIENSGKSMDTKLIGSLQRQTKIHPRATDTFDIDILVILGSFNAWTADGVQPQQAMQTMQDVVGDSERYSAMNPQQDAPTVSFEYHDDVKVELVPAYLDQIGSSASGVAHSPKGRAYWIVKNGLWVLADYDHEAEHISATNLAADGYLIPAIKMLKAARREHFPGMKPFHLEIVAAELVPAIIAARRQVNAEVSYPAIVTDFFKFASPRFANPVKIPGSHSEHFTLEEPAVLQKLEQVKNHCDAIGTMTSDTAKMEAWRLLFGEAFPSRA